MALLLRSQSRAACGGNGTAKETGTTTWFKPDSQIFEETGFSFRTLAQRFRERAPPLVASRHGEVLAPPVLYGRSLFAELASGPDGDGQGQQTVRAHLDRAEVLAWPDGALVDVDDPAALARARARLAGEDRRGDPSGS